MKKFFSLLLCLLLVGMLSTALAVEHEPGETFTISVGIVSLNTSFEKPGAGEIYVNSTNAPVTCLETAFTNGAGNMMVANPPASSNCMFGILNIGSLKVGDVGTVTFKVNDDAKPGKYTISVTGAKEVGAASGSYTFTIPGCIECVADEGTVTKKPTCTAEGEKVYNCTECGKLVKTEVLPKVDHDYTKETVTLEPTCTEDGVKTFSCTMCDKVSKTEAIAKLGHKEGELKVTKEATCVEDGAKQSTCTVCGAVITDEKIPALGHKVGESEVTKQPTCTETGLATGACTVCGKALENTEIPALGHTKDEGTVTTEPTCTKEGVKTYKCSVCGAELETEAVEVVPHTEDEGTVTVEPTCVVVGEMTYKCTVCGAVLRTEDVEPLGHVADEGTVTVEPTCTTEGLMVFKCTVCGEELGTESVLALGHTPGEWVIVKPSVGNEDGLKERYCTVCGELVDTAIIPGTFWYHMTASSIGPRFRDVTNLTNKWNMFTVVDLSVDGEQVFDLVAGDMHVIGKVIVTVAEGKVTVTYQLNHNEMKVVGESLSIVGSLEAITSIDELPAFNFGEEISIADQLGGDTTVILVIKNDLRYESNNPGAKDFCDGREYVALVEAMMELGK